MRNAIRLAFLAAALLPVLPVPAFAQALRWDALGSAGGFSVSGIAFLGATLGQPLNGKATAGAFVETVGFWHPAGSGSVAVEPPAAGIGGFRLAAIVPNPSADATQIRFTVPAGAGAVPISIEIVDLSGRVIRSLLSSPFEAGLHTIRWNGRAADGSLAPAGIYFCRLHAAGQRSVRSLALIR